MNPVLDNLIIMNKSVMLKSYTSERLVDGVFEF